jgi:hypothetical protein
LRDGERGRGDRQVVEQVTHGKFVASNTTGDWARKRYVTEAGI